MHIRGISPLPCLVRRTCAGVAGTISQRAKGARPEGRHVYAIKAKSYVRTMFRGDVIKKGDPDKSGRGISQTPSLPRAASRGAADVVDVGIACRAECRTSLHLSRC